MLTLPGSLAASGIVCLRFDPILAKNVDTLMRLSVLVPAQDRRRWTNAVVTLTLIFPWLSRGLKNTQNRKARSVTADGALLGEYLSGELHVASMEAKVEPAA